MSQVKISGDVSGTGILTIAAPNTNSNFTLTLPAATGTFNTSGVVNEVPAGTAALPAITTTGDTNTGIFFPAADTIAFTEGGVEAMRIDSSGNLLVGTTNTLPGYINTSTGAALNPNGTSCFSRGGADYSVVVNSNNSGTRFLIAFRASGSSVGSIDSNGTTTTYGTTSDYRLKENIAPMTGALEKVSALKPVNYTWKSTGETDQGFIAHELQEVCPSAVTGEKDAVDAEGKPQYQGIDTSFLVATLTAAIQEQQALITALTARITALEAI